MSEPEDEDFEHGQTYGEAVEEVTIEATEAIIEVYIAAMRLRAAGGEHNERMADELEAAGDELADKVDDLLETRAKMPFGLESAEGFGEAIQSRAVKAAQRYQREAWAEHEDE